MLASRMSSTRANRFCQERDRRVGRPAVHPGQQAQGEHVLRPRGVLAGQAELLDRLDRHPGQVDGLQRVLVQRVVLERVRVVPRLGQVAGGEVVGVDDDRRALGEVPQVRLQRGRVHRDEDVGGVARGEDVVVGEVHLERRDARQRALRRPDLGGEVGQRHQVVAEHGRLLGEPVPRQLHPVTGVAREPDDHPIQLLDLLGHLVHSLPRDPWVYDDDPGDRTRGMRRNRTCFSFPRNAFAPPTIVAAPPTQGRSAVRRDTSQRIRIYPVKLITLLYIGGKRDLAFN